MTFHHLPSPSITLHHLPSSSIIFRHELPGYGFKTGSTLLLLLTSYFPPFPIERYGKLIDYWLDERYTLRFCGGLVPDICQQFSKGQVLYPTLTPFS